MLRLDRVDGVPTVICQLRTVECCMAVVLSVRKSQGQQCFQIVGRVGGTAANFVGGEPAVFKSGYQRRLRRKVGKLQAQDLANLESAQASSQPIGQILCGGPDTQAGADLAESAQLYLLHDLTCLRTMRQTASLRPNRRSPA